jgi:tRNA A37 threonylcarbamoyladenosine synthetase subunit TsaC/SUA5/YrdC
MDVFGAMDGNVDLVLEAGPLTGLGATTVDITEPYWKVIREGAITEKQNRRVSEDRRRIISLDYLQKLGVICCR